MYFLIKIFSIIFFGQNKQAHSDVYKVMDPKILCVNSIYIKKINTVKINKYTFAFIFVLQVL